MDRSRPAAVIFVIGVIAGFIVGRMSAPGGCSDEPVVATAEPDDDATAPGPTSRAPTAEPAIRQPDATPRGTSASPATGPVPTSHAAEEDVVAALTAEVELLRGIIAANDEQQNGVPVAWTDNREPKFTEAGFSAALTAAIEDCKPPVALVGMDCSEPPCIALLRPEAGDWHDALVNGCPGWRDAYGTTVSQSTGKVDCGDGREEQIALLSPYDHEHRESLDKEDETNVRARTRHRWEQLRTDWECAPAE